MAEKSKRALFCAMICTGCRFCALPTALPVGAFFQGTGTWTNSPSGISAPSLFSIDFPIKSIRSRTIECAQEKDLWFCACDICQDVDIAFFRDPSSDMGTA